MKWLQFILSHSIFISFCAFSLCWQTFQLLHIPFNFITCWLIFFSTLGCYNLYWLISKYHFSDRRGLLNFLVKHFSNLLVMLLAGIGFCYNLYFSKDLFPAFFIAILLMLLYTVPLWPIKQLAFTRRTGFLKTVLLAFTWAYITVILPVQQSVPVNGFSVGFLFSARFLFMLMLCIIFDSRDSRVDKIRSLRSLATDVSKEALSCIMRIVFTLFIGAGFLLRYYFNDIAQVIAFFITGLMTMLVYRLSLKNRGYLFYYFLVDGLMLFSAVATFVASI